MNIIKYISFDDRSINIDSHFLYANTDTYNSWIAVTEKFQELYGKCSVDCSDFLTIMAYQIKVLADNLIYIQLSYDMKDTEYIFSLNHGDKNLYSRSNNICIAYMTLMINLSKL